VYFRFNNSKIHVNIATNSELERTITERFLERRGFALATINLDHIVQLKRDARFLAAYLKQDFVVADGNPVTWLAKLANRPVGLLPGSDLIMPICRIAAMHGIKVALVGSTDEVLDLAAEQIRKYHPEISIPLRLSPTFGFDPEGEEALEILEQLKAANIQLCLLALGAPKQEMLAARGRDICCETGFVSIGAGLDFLAGKQKRAPKWVRSLALEWLWRALSNPRRLAVRYVRSALILPGEIVAALMLRRSN